MDRHDVRIPHAVAGNAQLSRDVAGRNLRSSGVAPNRIWPRARRALGNFGIGLRGARSAFQLSIRAFRRSRLGTEARSDRRPGGLSLFDDSGCKRPPARVNSKLESAGAFRRAFVLWIL